METTNDASKGKLFNESAYDDAKHKDKIEKLSTLICKSFGNDLVDWFNSYFDPKISGRRLTIEEYSKLVNEDEYFKIISACINQRNLRRIGFWVFFWSVLSIIGAIVVVIYILTHGANSYPY
jgi:hypothetical protein